MATPDPQLDQPIPTERLVLRRPLRGDIPAIFGTWAQDAEVTRYVIWPTHRSLADTEAFIGFADDGWADGSEYTWLICLKDGGMPIGSFALRPDGGYGSIGYVIARHHWGQGIAAEAGRRILEVGFEEFGLQRIGAYCDLENVASARVMEKLGMEFEGTTPDCLVFPALSSAPRDCLFYSVSRDRWAALRTDTSGLQPAGS